MDEETFSGSLLFSGLTLLTYLLKVLNSKVLMIMSYYDHFLDLSTVWCCYQCASSQEAFVVWWGVKTNIKTMYVIPGCITVLEIPVI